MRFTDEGWVELGRPSSETVAEARRRLAEGDRARGSTPRSHDRHMGPDELLRGYVAELGVRKWLWTAGVRSVVYDGGFNGAPDFLIAGRGVGVRCCGANGEWSPALHVCNPAPQMEHAERLFVGHERLHDRYLILGGLKTLALRAQARLVRAGDTDPVFGNRRQKFDVYVYPAAELEPPAGWLERLTT